MTAERRADARFVLPTAPGRAALVGVPGTWRAGLELAGTGVDRDAAGGPDLVVCSPAGLPEALSGGAEVVLVEGDVARVPGWASTRWTVLLRRDEPLALVPHGVGPALRLGLEAWTPAGPRTALLKRGLQTTARVGRAPGLPVLTVVTAAPAEPLVLRTARALGADGPLVPVVLTGGGSLRRRVATLLLRPGAEQAHLVLKTERHAGGLDRAQRDRRWSTAAAAAGAPGAHVPQVLAISAEDDGPVSSLEEGAPGRALAQLLVTDPGAARAALPGLAAWLVDLAVRTTGRGTRPPWSLPSLPDPAGLLVRAAEAVAGVPGVLTHGDLLDGGNVLVAAGRLSVVDWETAQEQGPPLQDLLPAVSYAQAVLRVGPQPRAVADEVVRCALGQSPDSEALRSQLLSWTRALGLDASVAGPLSLLAWAHHGAQPGVHRRELVEAGLPEQHWDSVPELVAQAWLEHPGLGLTWSALLSQS